MRNHRLIGIIRSIAKACSLLALAAVLAFLLYYFTGTDGQYRRNADGSISKNRHMEAASTSGVQAGPSAFDSSFNSDKNKIALANKRRGIRPERRTEDYSKIGEQTTFSKISDWFAFDYVPSMPENREKAWVYLFARRFHAPETRSGHSFEYNFLYHFYEDSFFNQSCIWEALCCMEGNLKTGIMEFNSDMARERDLTVSKSFLCAAMSRTAMSYERICKRATAMSYYKRALELSREIGDKSLESVVSTNFGILYARMGRLEKAHSLFEVAMSIDGTTGDREGSIANRINIGIAQALGGDTSSAETSFQDARMQIAEQATGPLADLEFLIEHNLAVAGAAHRNNRETLERLNEVEKRMSDYQNRPQGTHRMAALMVNKGEAQMAMEHFGDARAAYNKALSIMDSLSCDKYKCDCGGIYRRIVGFNKNVVKEFDESFYLFDGELYWRAIRGLAATCIGEGWKIDSAVANYRIALEAVDHLRFLVQDTADRAAYMSDKRWLYNEIIDDLVSLHYESPDKNFDKEAWEIFEMKQGREFLDRVGRSGARNFSRKPRILIDTEKKLEDVYTKIIANIGNENFKALYRIADLAYIFDEVVDLRSQMVRDFSEYSDLISPKTVSYEQMSNDILGGKEAVAVYHVTADHTILWLISPNGFQMFAIPEGEADLEALVEGFRYFSADRLLEAVDKGVDTHEFDRIVDESYQDYQKIASRLFRILFPSEALDAVRNADMLYIVPTGPLHGLPFEALVAGDIEVKGRPALLLDNCAVSYLSSASMLKVLKDTREKRQAEIETKRKSLLAFGNPVFSDAGGSRIDPADSMATGPTESEALRNAAFMKLMGETFIPLPETEREVLAIAESLKQKDPESVCDVYVKEQAVRSRIFELNDSGALDDYQYAVFATHAVLPREVDEILQPAIVLGDCPDGAYLTMSDIYGLKMNADLVVLSACNTGRGDRVPGEGVLGMTRAFMYAGTSSTAVNLWAVESLSAERIDRDLFERMADGTHPAQALRASKLAMIDTPDENGERTYRHPFFWAPMVVFGRHSPGTDENKKKNDFKVVVQGPTHFEMPENNAKEYKNKVNLRRFSRLKIYDLEWNGFEFAAACQEDSVVFSPDGKNWYKERTGSGKKISLDQIRWIGDRYVMSGYNRTSTGEYLFTSPNGFQWRTLQRHPPVAHPGLSWGNPKFAYANGLLVQTNSNSYCKILVTRDLEQWREVQIPEGKSRRMSIRDIVYGGPPGGEFFVLVGKNIWISPDADDWQIVYRCSGEMRIHRVHWNGNQFLALAENCILRSKDGIHWEESDYFGPKIYAVEHNGEYYAGVGSYWGFISENGVDWTKQKIEFSGRHVGSMNLDDIVYSGELFVAAGKSGHFVYSEDGYDWKLAR